MWVWYDTLEKDYWPDGWENFVHKDGDIDADKWANVIDDACHFRNSEKQRFEEWFWACACNWDETPGRFAWVDVSAPEYDADLLEKAIALTR